MKGATAKMSLKSYRFSVLCLVLMLITLFSALVMPTPVSASGTGDSGVSYKVSDDGTYLIITGYDEQFPAVNIESEIDGLPVKEIAESAFQNCSVIYSITIPDSVEKIGEKAFRDCANLVSVKLPSGLKELPFEAFRDCRLLSSITLPETLEKINDFCFQGCSSLRKLKIPSSVNSIGHDVFMYCESIHLDVSENRLAADYAEKYSVNTDFKGTTLYFALMMLLGSAVAIVIGVLLITLLKRYFAKHPTHNPFIYIGRAFGVIKKYLMLLIEKLKALLSRLFDICVDLGKKLLEKIKKQK